MAIKLSYSLPCGVTADYWRIDEIKLYKTYMFVLIALYLNAENKNVPLYSLGVKIDTTLDEYTDNPMAIAYEKIKTVDLSDPMTGDPGIAFGAGEDC